MTRYSLDLVSGRGGVWAALRNDLPAVISLLIPDHVRSPRRAKTLLNNYVFAYRVAIAKPGLSGWLAKRDGRLQLAKAVCIRTEFPLLYQDIEDEPELIDALTAIWTDDKAAQQRFQTRPSLWRLARAHDQGKEALDVELTQTTAVRLKPA